MNSNTRVWGIALIVSMMLNTFAIGLLLSDRFAPRGFGGPPPPEAPHFEPGDNTAESQRVRKLFQELRASTHKDFIPLMQGIRQARQQVGQALNTETFDPEQLETALAELRRAEQAAAEHAHRTISQLALTLTAEERRHLAQLVRRHRPSPQNRMARPRSSGLQPPHGARPPPPDEP